MGKTKDNKEQKRAISLFFIHYFRPRRISLGLTLFISFLFLGFFGLAGSSEASPSISNVSGTVSNGQSINITGSGFGTKSPAKPILWADFTTSLDPSSLGIKTSWDAIGNVTWDATEKSAQGIPYLAEEWWNEAWVLRTDGVNWTGDGQKAYVYRRVKMNFLITSTSQNWKSWRMWPDSTNYPNIYTSYSHGTVTVEGCNSGEWFDIEQMRPNTTDWRTEEIIFQASTYNQSNGSIIYKRNGTVAGQYNQLMTRCSTYPSYMTQHYPVHGVAANATTWDPPWNSSNNYWADDIYVDTTWSRVMICAGSTWANSGHCEIQIPAEWGDSSAIVTVQTGILTGNNYLYVVDSANTANSAGYPVVVGGGTPPDTTPPAAPSGLSVQ